MAKTTKKMAKTIILKNLSRATSKKLYETTPKNYLHGQLVCRLKSIPEDILIWVSKSDNSNQEPNLHHRHTLLINLQDKFEVGIGRNIFELDANEAVLIFPRQLHYYLPFKSGLPMKLFVSFEIPDHSDTSLLPLKDCVFKIDKEEIALLHEILENNFGGGQEDCCSMDYAVLSFCMLLSRLLSKIERNPITKQNITSDKLGKILNFIYDNYQHKISLKDIAAHVSMSESHLRQFFRKETKGLTAGKFLRTVRLFKSFELLAHSSMTVSEIAYACGFSDPYMYSRAAKRRVAESPSMYRKLVRRLEEK